MLGVSFKTLKRWTYSGKVKAERSIAGRWFVSESEIGRLLGTAKEGRPEESRKKKGCIIYAGVSSHEQKDHLKSQVEKLTKYAPSKGYDTIKVYEEVASGLENRGKLASAYLVRERKADLVLVEFKDRLSRFGFNYLSRRAESYGASVEMVNGVVKKDAMQELVEGIISIVTTFSAKLHGLRSQKFRQDTGVVESAIHG